MKVLLWECAAEFFNIVLYDGENIYWNDEMNPSSRYKKLKYNKISKITKSRFTYIGEL